MLWRVLLMTFLFLGHSLGLESVLTVTDFMLFDSADLLYFEVLQPENISYIYKVRLAKDFGGEFDFSSDSVNLVAADPPQACYSAINGRALRKSVALVQRGGCSFVTKSKLVESYGAIAVFIADNELNNGEVLVDMIQDGTGRDVHIPAAFMFGSDGYHIKRGIKEAGMDKAVISLPLNMTGRPHLYMRQPPWSFW